MAWFRKMGIHAVQYHEETVLGRGDDHPGQALDYYGSRGETPLRWGGAEAARLGLSGEVTLDDYRAVFGPGGCRHPQTGERLVNAKVPGFELTVSAHKTLAVLGIVARADDMHAILDAETDGVMEALETWMQDSGGRRGKAAVPTPTTGLVYAVTRHATSRAGDPGPHDHILIANITYMLDARGDPKALHSALIRDWAEAAAMVGRLRAAAKAIELGYPVELDHGPSGRARDFRIVGIPAEVCELYSKRSDQIDEYLETKGYTGYRARNIAARATRPVKRGTGVDELMPRWTAELEQIGWTVEGLAAALEEARSQCTGLAPRLSDREIDRMAAELLDPEGDFSTRCKTFGRRRLIAEIAPRLYGHDPDELDHVIDRILASELVVPLIGVPGAVEQHYATRAVLATEETIAARIDHLATAAGPQLPSELVAVAIADKQIGIGAPLSTGQRATVEAICGSGRGIDVIVGVAGAGKTTAIDAAASALAQAGYRVVGTATSGQAARTLTQETGVEARTMRSLLYRLDHGQLTLTNNTVVVLDEAGMTADADLARLLLAAERVGAKVVLVGDPRQLSSVGPGGALAAVLDRHPEIVTTLTENKRQLDPAERTALAHLRDGDLDPALAFYQRRDRIRVAPDRVQTLDGMVETWATDIAEGHHAVMMAWQRRNVADLNRLARYHAHQAGWLSGPDLQAPGGRGYAAGDPVVLLSPNHVKALVTSQRGTVTAVDMQAQALTLVTDHGRQVTLSGEEIDAEHLDHAYAMTVHRSQGLTCDRAHLYADGGGPELAYVAVSRARDTTTIHADAADLDEAIENLRYDWQRSSAQRWVTDTATGPGIDPRHRPSRGPRDRGHLAIVAAVRVAKLEHELETLTRSAPPDVAYQLTQAHHRLHQLEGDRRDLDTGRGRWAGTTQAAAVARLQAARDGTHLANTIHVHAHGLKRHSARHALQTAKKAEALAYQDWQTTVEPVADRLDKKITAQRRHVDQLAAADQRHRLWQREHPGQARRINQLKTEIDQLPRDPRSHDPSRDPTRPARDPHDREAADTATEVDVADLLAEARRLAGLVTRRAQPEAGHEIDHSPPPPSHSPDRGADLGL